MVFLIISINFFGFCDAPPIKNPSMPGIIFNWSIFLLLTEPPYKTIGVFFVLKLFFNSFLINLNIFFKFSGLGILPVPIDQTGS